MSKYLLNKFHFTIDRDPDLVERYRTDPAGTVAWWEAERAGQLLNCSAGEAAWVSTTRSLSTYTIRDSGAVRCATSWVLPAVGIPVPMSRNWRTPASPARNRTPRPRNARFARAAAAIAGSAASARSAAARSTAKLSFAAQPVVVEIGRAH